MPWYQVSIGWTSSCGGETQEYITKARSPKHAKEKVLEVHGKVEGRDRVDVYDLSEEDNQPPRVHPNGVIYTHFDYWER